MNIHIHMNLWSTCIGTFMMSTISTNTAHYGTEKSRMSTYIFMRP